MKKRLLSIVLTVAVISLTIGIMTAMSSFAITDDSNYEYTTEQEMTCEFITDQFVETSIVEPTSTTSQEHSTYSDNTNNVESETMQTSENGLMLIKAFEECHLVAYKSSSIDKYYTIGWGHYGSDVSKDMTITQEQADQLLRDDIKEYESAVVKFALEHNREFTQNQFDALVSFTYQTGIGSWTTHSEYLIHKYMAGEVGYTETELYRAFMSWSYGNSSDIIKRRLAECSIFLTPDSVPYELWKTDENTHLNKSYSMLSEFVELSNNAELIVTAKKVNRGVTWGYTCCYVGDKENGSIKTGWVILDGATKQFGSIPEIPSMLFTYSKTDNGNQITGYLGTEKSVIIPNELDGEPVIGIGDFVFDDCTELTRITIPYSVTSIGDNAFYNCTSLTSMTIGKDVTDIGENAFYNCPIKEVVISDGSKEEYYSVENGVLFNKDKTELVKYPIGIKNESYSIPNGVTKIRDGAFENCTSLSNITIPDSVKTIGAEAFSGCTSLASVKMSELTDIRDGAFENCTSLLNITIPDSVKTIGAEAFSGCTSLTSVKMSESTDIGKNAFNGCESVIIETGIYDYVFLDDESIKITKYTGDMAEVEVPSKINGKTVKKIDYEAFANCTSLKEITIPESVTELCDTEQLIGDSPFVNCTSLISINVSTNNNYYCSENGVLFNKDKTKLIQYPVGKTNKQYTVPKGVTEIRDGAFIGCTSLTNLTISNSVNLIGVSAFWGCTSLTSVTITDSVTSVCVGAFEKCPIKEIIIADGSKNITSTMIVSKDIESITIPDSVTSIGAYTFSSCSSLKRVNITDIAKWREISFSGCYNNPLYYAKNLYLNGELVTDLIIPDSVTRINAYAFYNCTSLTSVTISDSVTSVGNEAFYNCPIDKIIITDGSKTVTSAMIVSKSIENIAIPNSVTSIGDSAFNGCTKLTSIIIPDNVTSIGNSAFKNCTGLTSIKIPNKVKSVGNSAFIGCTKLASMTMPNSVTNIGDSAFSDCTKLASAILSNSISSIGNNAFKNCTSLTSVAIPESVASIGSYAFFNCPNLNSITLSDKIKEIKDKAIGYNTSSDRNLDLVVHCYKDSKAHAYAFANQLNYEFLNPDEPFPTDPSTVIYGDCNGDEKINLLDLLCMRKYLAKWNITIDENAADCNCDSKVNILDLILMRKYLAKWNVVLGPQK